MKNAQYQQTANVISTKVDKIRGEIQYLADCEEVFKQIDFTEYIILSPLENTSAPTTISDISGTSEVTTPKIANTSADKVQLEILKSLKDIITDMRKK